MICTKCKKDLPLSSFHKNQTRCKDCRKISCKESYEKHRDKRLLTNKITYQNDGGKKREQGRKWKLEHKKEKALYARKYRAKRRLEIISHYSNGTMVCAKCGYNDIRALCLDHINGDGAIHRKSLGRGESFYNDIIKNNFKHKLQVLCHNCNYIKRLENDETYSKY